MEKVTGNKLKIEESQRLEGKHNLWYTQKSFLFSLQKLLYTDTDFFVVKSGILKKCVRIKQTKCLWFT
jgi:hypothetical protein